LPDAIINLNETASSRSSTMMQTKAGEFPLSASSMAERSASMTACSILLIAARRRPASRATAAGCGRPARRRQQGKQVIPKPTQPNVDISQVPQIQQTQVRPDMQPGQGGNMNLAPPFRSAPAEASKLTAFAAAAGRAAAAPF
jgi:hypothetical protein